MTARDFYNKEEKYSVFTKLTSTGISDDLDKITEFAEDYHNAKLELLRITNTSNCVTDLEYSLYRQVVNLKEKVKKLEFIVENGLDEEDMINDIALILWKHSKKTETDICIPKQNIKELITEINDLKSENTKIREI